jgi:hypothetical protein
MQESDNARKSIDKVVLLQCRQPINDKNLLLVPDLGLNPKFKPINGIFGTIQLELLH